MIGPGSDKKTETKNLQLGSILNTCNMKLLHKTLSLFILVIFCRTFFFWHFADLFGFPFLHIFLSCQLLVPLIILLLLRTICLVLDPLLRFFSCLFLERNRPLPSCLRLFFLSDPCFAFPRDRFCWAFCLLDHGAWFMCLTTLVIAALALTLLTKILHHVPLINTAH